MQSSMLPAVFQKGSRQMEEYLIALFRYLEQFELLRFLGASGVSGIVFAGIFFPLIWWMKSHYRASLYIAFVPSLVAGFLLHKYWTFRDFGMELVWLKLALYTLKRLVLIRVNDHGLVWLVDGRGWYITLAQIVIAVLGLGVNYFILKLIFSL